MKNTQKLNQNWFHFITQVRQLMQTKGYEEVLTPTLVHAGAMESQLDPFQTSFRFGNKQVSLELPTSPEFHLKKLLGLGWGSIFEIKPCFRNGEYSEIHRPEFTMLEFYKVGANLENLMSEVKNIVLSLWNSQGFTQELKTNNKSIAELFSSLNINLTPKTSHQQLLEFTKETGIYTAPDDDFNELYFRIWLEKIEPFFLHDEITFVYDFPPSQAALAELNPKGWADRFEFFWRGLELGNAFKEIRNADILRQRYEIENAKRKSQGLKPHPIDEELLRASEKMPECSGIAIGLERLFMAIHNIKNISEFKVLDFKP